MPAGELADTGQRIGNDFSPCPDARCLRITDLTSAYFDPEGGSRSCRNRSESEKITAGISPAAIFLCFFKSLLTFP